MSVKQIVSGWFKNFSIFNFNLVNRDAWVATQAAALPSGSRVLDAGAGSCPYRKLFAHCDYKTQDFAGLQDSQLSGGAYGAIDYVCDITDIPVDDASFDAVLCSEVIEHVPDPVAVIDEFARILKPGGKLMLTAPLGSGIHQEPYHYYGGFTPYWYRRVLGEKGFEEIIIKANGGSLQAFSQESLRFLQMTRPFGGMIPALASIIWLPVWLSLLPFLAGVVPLAAHVLDKYDHDKHFTVGYFVTAVRR